VEVADAERRRQLTAQAVALGADADEHLAQRHLDAVLVHDAAGDDAVAGAAAAGGAGDGR
jgi:hypothetical protein